MTLAPWRRRIARPEQAIGIHAHALPPQPVSRRGRRYSFRVHVGVARNTTGTDERLLVAAEGDADGHGGGSIAEVRDLHAFHVGNEAVCGAGLEKEDDQHDEGVDEEDGEAEDDEDEEDVEFLGDEMGGEGEAEISGGLAWYFFWGGGKWWVKGDLQSDRMTVRNMAENTQCIAFRRSFGSLIPAKQDRLDCVVVLGFFCLLGFFFFWRGSRREMASTRTSSSRSAPLNCRRRSAVFCLVGGGGCIDVLGWSARKVSRVNGR